MIINNSNYKRYSCEEMFQAINQGDFTLQTVNFDSQLQDRLIQELVKRNSALEASHSELFEEVKALRVCLNDLQKIWDHPSPISISDKDIEAANAHDEKRTAQDNADQEEAQKQQEAEAERIRIEAEEKERKVAEARAEVQRLIDEAEQMQKEKQAEIDAARKKAEDLSDIEKPEPTTVAEAEEKP